MIHTHRDNVLDILESFTIEGVEPPKTGLEMLIATWTENAEAFQGLWSQRIRYWYKMNVPSTPLTVVIVIWDCVLYYSPNGQVYRTYQLRGI